MWDERTLLESDSDADCGDPVCLLTNFDGTAVDTNLFVFTRFAPLG